MAFSSSTATDRISSSLPCIVHTCGSFLRPSLLSVHSTLMPRNGSPNNVSFLYSENDGISAFHSVQSAIRANLISIASGEPSVPDVHDPPARLIPQPHIQKIRISPGCQFAGSLLRFQATFNISTSEPTQCDTDNALLCMITDEIFSLLIPCFDVADTTCREDSGVWPYDQSHSGPVSPLSDTPPYGCGLS